VLTGFDRAGQARKRIPPRRILFRSGGRFAITGREVQVLATARTKSLAVFLAERAGGQGEKHLFAHDIFKRETALLIVTDFGLVGCDGALAGVCVGGLGTEDEVEVAGELRGDRLDAARAEQLEAAVVGGAQANVWDLLAVAAALYDEVGAAGDGQRACLVNVGGVVQRAGGDRLVEEERFLFELEGSDEHEVKRRAMRGRGQWEEPMVSLARFSPHISCVEGLGDAAHNAVGGPESRTAEGPKFIEVVSNKFMDTMASSRGGAMSSTTKYLGKLLGFYSVLVALAMIVHKQATVEMVQRMMGHGGAPFAIGLISVAVGLAMVLGHNVWRGGALPVVVTLIGWWSLIKGLLCLFLPVGVIAGLLGGPHYAKYFYVSPVISLLVGLYLIYASSFGKADQATVK